MRRVIKKELGFHGETIKKSYFEGWYYKITSDTFSLSIIVGINKNTKDDHGFIQTLDTISGKEQYIRYDISQVCMSNDPFYIRMGENYFYSDMLILNIEHQVSIKVHIQLGDFHYLNPTIYAPTIMGPFSYVPFMECVHAVYSLYHRCIGKIEINNKEMPVSNAVGYIEKDRGTSFPESYFWLQSNHLKEQKKASLFLSIASIPLSMLHFTGIIMVIMLDEKQLRFSTYYGAKVRVIKKIKNNGYKIIIEQGKYRICIKAYLGKRFALSAPSIGEMKHTVYETLSASGQVHVYKQDRLLLNKTFINAGCEVRGY